MNNSKLINTIFLSQFLLIFISFNIPNIKNKVRQIKTSANESVLLKSEFVSDKMFSEVHENVKYTIHYPFHENDKEFNNFVKEQFLNPPTLFSNFSHQCLETWMIKNYSNINIDYKLYTNDKIISGVFFKSLYSNDQEYLNTYYTTFSYDRSSKKTVKFKEFFKPNCEQQVIDLINLSDNFKALSSDYNCQKINTDTFNYFKNNFVIEDDFIKFYLTDCEICDYPLNHSAIQINMNDIKNLINTL